MEKRAGFVAEEIVTSHGDAKYRALFENLPLAVILIDPATARPIEFNRAILDLLGYSAKEFSQLRLSDYDVHESPEKILSAIARAMQTGRVAFETKMLTKDGRILNVNVTVSPLETERKTLMHCVVEDITERKTAEVALRESEEKLRSLLENVPDYVVEMELDGTVVMTNRGFGNASSDQVVGGALSEFIGPEAVAAFRAESARAVSTGETQVYETSTELDGDEHWFSVRVIPIASACGAVRILAMATDITADKQNEKEKLRLEAQMQEAQKVESLGVLAGGIAHDFNNLLAAILGNADLAAMKLAPSAPGHAELEAIISASERAADICKQMLAYAGQGRYVVEDVNLSATVSDMKNLLEASSGKNVEFKTDLADDLPDARADISQMRQVIINLVTNAAEAIGNDTGIVTISTGVVDCSEDYLNQGHIENDLPAGRYVYLDVNDTGPGMDEETRKKIFDPFFSTKFTGRGLGLAAVLGIIRSHGGTIRVQSQPGCGTTFRALMPIVEDSRVPEDFKEPAREFLLASAQKILIVDDEEGVRMVAEMILDGAGFETLLACNGFEAIEIFQAQPDVAAILLDLTMPKMSGEETLIELQRIRADVPIVLSTGYDERTVADRLAGHTFAGFIQKPYRAAALVEAIARAAGNPEA